MRERCEVATSVTKNRDRQDTPFTSLSPLENVLFETRVLTSYYSTRKRSERNLNFRHLGRCLKKPQGCTNVGINFEDSQLSDSISTTPSGSKSSNKILRGHSQSFRVESSFILSPSKRRTRRCVGTPSLLAN